MLARSDARHVVVLGQRREVLVQLLDALLVRFGAAFAFEALVELEKGWCVSNVTCGCWSYGVYGRSFSSRREVLLTLLRLISSCLRCASVLPEPAPELLGSWSLGVASRSECVVESARSVFVVLLSPTSASPSCDVLGLGALSLELLLFLLFFLTPASLAPPFSLRPPEMVLV